MRLGRLVERVEAAPDRQLGAAVFVLIVITHIRFLTLPASHDASWSVFAAAQTLADNGFDYPALIGEGGYLSDGSATHATSSVTFVTAIVLWLLGTGDLARITLHLLHMLIGAIGLVVWVRIGQTMLPRRWALGAVAAAAATPLMFTQLGFMYLEIPLFAAAGGALLAYLRGRLGWAVALSLLAVSIKLAGIVVAAAIAATVLLYDRGRMRWAAGLVASSTVLVALITSQEEAATTVGSVLNWSFTRALWELSSRHTALTLDAGLPLVLLLPALAWCWRYRSSEGARERCLMLALLVAFVGLFYTGPVAGFFVLVLPRYWTLLLPALYFVVLSPVRSGDAVLGLRATASLFAAVVVLGYIWLPTPDEWRSHFVIAERSPRVADILELEGEAIDHLIASDATPLAWRDTDFRLRFDAAGFVDEPFERHLAVESVDPFGPLPERVVFIERPGRRTHTLHRDQLSDGWSIEETRLSRGEFELLIVEASRP